MEINKSLKKRIKEVNLVMQGSNKEELQQKFSDLLLIFDRVDKEHMESSIVKDVQKLKDRILIDNVKSKLKEASGKEKKLNKIDDFKELCNLMKYNQFDEALRKFYEKDK